MTQQYPRLAELPFDSDRKPKPKDESLSAHGLGLRIVLQGVMFALLSLAAFAIGEAYSSSISIKTVIVKIGGGNGTSEMVPAGAAAAVFRHPAAGAAFQTGKGGGR